MLRGIVSALVRSRNALKDTFCLCSWIAVHDLQEPVRASSYAWAKTDFSVPNADSSITDPIAAGLFLEQPLSQMRPWSVPPCMQSSAFGTRLTMRDIPHSVLRVLD